MTAARKRRAFAAGGPLTAAVLGGLLLIAGMIGSGGGAHASSDASETAPPFGPSADTYIQEGGSANTTFGTAETLAVDGNSGTTAWTGIAFNLLSIPSDATIQSATLTMTVKTAPTAEMDVFIRRNISGSTWDNTATWNLTQPDWSIVTPGFFRPVSVVGPVAFDVTSDVAFWMTGTPANNGWVLLSTDADSLTFDSSDAGSGTPPSLSVTYLTSETTLKPPDGTPSPDTSGGFEDTWVQFDDAGMFHGDEDHLAISLTASDRHDALIRFGLTTESPAIASGRIVSATLTLPVITGAASIRTFQAGRICTPAGLSVDGEVSLATYDGLPYSQLNTEDGVDYVYSPGDSSLTFDVTAIVQKWADGEANLGFRIRQTGSFLIDSIEIGSFNNTTDSNRPSLAIEWVSGSNPTPTPLCQQATPTPTPSNTPLPTDTPTSLPTNTPLPTDTPTPLPADTPTPLPTETATPVGTATPATSAELLLTGPSVTVAVARSRLQFDATAGSLAPDSVTFVIKRSADDMFWNGATSAWEAAEVANAGVDSSGTWSFVVAGTDRRAFADTTITVEVRAAVGGDNFNTAPLSVTVR